MKMGGMTGQVGREQTLQGHLEHINNFGLHLQISEDSEGFSHDSKHDFQKISLNAVGQKVT